MERLGISHQTLNEFLTAPFGISNKQKNLEYDSRYEKYKRENKIRVESSVEYEGNYFIHLKVPSESQKGSTYYDVVVQFFPPSEKHKTDLSVEKYYVQFFSNSPGFVYKYAALYRLEGYLIEALADKFTPGTLETLPDKANKTYELGYDSSIYYACRYLRDHKFYTLGKLNIKIFKTKTITTFLRDIQDVESVNISRDIVGLERSLKKEIERDSKLSESQKTKLKQNDFFGKKILKKDNSKYVKKIGAKSFTGKESSVKRVTAKGKKKSSKSTIKK